MTDAGSASTLASQRSDEELQRLRAQVAQIESAAEPSAEQKRMYRAAEDLEDLFLVMVESGLFKDSSKPDRAESILKGIATARAEIRRRDPDAAATYLALAELEVHRAIHAKSPWWRIRRIHQLPLLVYYVIFLGVLLNVASGWFGWTAETLWAIPTAAFGLGALGAILRGLYYLHRQVARRIYRSGFLLAHLAAPWIGGMFGLFTYLLLQAGLLALEGTREGDDLASSPLALALALLAGFKWEWLLAQLDRIGGAKGSESPLSQAEGGTGAPAGGAAPAAKPLTNGGTSNGGGVEPADSDTGTAGRRELPADPPTAPAEPSSPPVDADKGRTAGES